MKAFFALLLTVWASSPAWPQTVSSAGAAGRPVQELLARIHKNRLDGRVYQVRDLTLVREDVRVYFTEGTLALLEPLTLETGRPSRVLGALFVGEGEILVMPPNIVEKRNLARFTGAPVLNEKLSSIFLRFTDDTAAQLLKGLGGRAAEPGSDEFIEQWSPVVHNLNLMYDLRVLADLLAAPSTQASFFAARLWGQRLGAIDIVVDQRAVEHISVSQVNWKDGRRYLDLWCSFPASSRGAGMAFDAIRPRSYKIDATIRATRQMDVTAEVELEAEQAGERALFFELSRFLKVSSVHAAETALPFFQNEVGDESQVKQRGNDLLLVVLPAPVQAGSRLTLKVSYSGEVISDAGNGVYFVGARGIWYPNRGYQPADFELAFRYPKNLRLVATGDRLQESEEGEMGVSRWKSKRPLRVAGFNIGEYVSSSATAADGTVVEVYANRALETTLEALRPRAVILDPIGPPAGPAARRRTAVVLPPPPPPSPAGVAETIAKDQARAVDYLVKILGPLPFGRVAISPIPGNFGQGWPGLVYLSTTSYLLPYDPGGRNTSESTDVFFRTILPVHELAHQWWGHVVRPASYREDWLIEALAAYTALLWLEQDGKAGPRQIRLMLEKHRASLLRKIDDETAESAGPPVLGHRLTSSKNPHGVDTVVYLKGPWIVHMLRQLMRDPKTGSDAAFFQFLRALRDEYATQPLTTAAFRAAAERFVYPENNAEKGRNLEWFFDQWVYGVGIPEVKVSAKVEAPRAARPAGKTGAALRATPGRVTGSATLEGVDDSWLLPVPIYVQTVRGEVYAGVAVAEAGSSGQQARFVLPLPAPAQRAVADPFQTLLAVWK